MYKCNKCNKNFEYQSYLNAHIKRKTSCDKQITDLKCHICNIEFTNLYNKERHETSDKHIKNITINNNINNNFNIIMNLTLNINTFNNSRIDFIDFIFIKQLNYHYKLEIINNISDGNGNYSIINILDKTIDIMFYILEYVNFNKIYSENHNCKIFVVIPNSNKYLYEYLILEHILNNNNLYQWKCVKFNDFLVYIYNLMIKIISKLNNILIKDQLIYNNFKNYIKFIYINLILNEENKEIFQKKIEIKLHKIYNKIHHKRVINDNLNYNERIEEYKKVRKNECRLKNGYNPDIIDSLI